MMPQYKPSRRYAEYVYAVLSCGHWEETGRVVKHSHAEIRHIETGETTTYGMHDGGNDRNGPRNFASLCGRICGCRFVQPRGRKASRRKAATTGFRIDSPVNEGARSRIEFLLGLHQSLIESMRRMDPVADDRKLRRLSARLNEVRGELENRHQPLPEIK